MADPASVAVDEPDVGDRDALIETVTLTQGGDTVHRQVVQEASAAAIQVAAAAIQAAVEATLTVADDYASVEHLADQDGADAVLTFTAAAAGRLVWVDVDPTDPTDTDNYRCRATIDGSVPTSTQGHVCRPGGNPIPGTMTGTDVQVFAPTGVVVAVSVFGR